MPGTLEDAGNWVRCVLSEVRGLENQDLSGWRANGACLCAAQISIEGVPVLLALTFHRRAGEDGLVLHVRA